MKVMTCLWFESEALEAAEFYCSLFPGSKVTAVSYYATGMHMPEGTVLYVSFELAGRPFGALNGGSQHPHSDAHSMVAHCDTQEELDALWEKLTADGGEEVQCGWLKDKYGVSWQTGSPGLQTMLDSGDSEGLARMFAALGPMKKLDLAAMDAAFRGE